MYSGELPPSLNELLGKLMGVIPEIAFDPKELIDFSVVNMIGELDEDSSDDADATVAETTADALLLGHLNLPAGKPMTLFISSVGGSVLLGLHVQSMINRLRRDGRVVIGHVVGFAFSAAQDILQACDIRRIEQTGGIMLHEDQFETSGSTSTNKIEVAFSERMERMQYDIIAARTGKPVSFYQQKTKKNWYLTATEALEEGLVDEIMKVPTLPKALHVVPKKPRAPRIKRVVEPDVIPPT